MEFKALIEKLDWKGNVVRTVKKYDEPRFMPDMTHFFREAIETGEINTKNLPEPQWSWDFSVNSIIKKIAYAKSQYYFKETEPGIRMVVGEFYPALDAQFIVFDKRTKPKLAWVKTDQDMIREVENDA